MPAALRVLGGRRRGALILLRNGFLIGREEDCHLRPRSDLVSRHHCVFTVDAFTTRLRDLGSRNGTFVNGARISGHVALKSGDKLRIGTLLLEFVLDAPQAPGEAPDAISAMPSPGVDGLLRQSTDAISSAGNTGGQMVLTPGSGDEMHPLSAPLP